ncbi:MAG: hypothetical protein HYU51_02320 [Candidatus Rokubacteria bacterium]|nr:hypothetical protein [Candidatus Rokubacteria bacterium]
MSLVLAAPSEQRHQHEGEADRDGRARDESLRAEEVELHRVADVSLQEQIESRRRG